MKLINNITIGADPEVFLVTKDGDKPYPACGLIGGTKDYPIEVTEKGHAVQEDNVAAEFCIPPSKTVRELQDNINFMLDHISFIIPKTLKISKAASLFFSKEDLESPQAKEFGCDPSFNHWTGLQNKSPKSTTTLRTAGGHVHVGYDNPSEHISNKFMAALELYLAVPSILMDTDTERRKMYGKSGEMRYKPYGFELRVLSNFWIFSNTHIKWVFDGVLKAAEFVNSGREVDAALQKRIIHTIDTSNTLSARGLCEQFYIDHFVHKIIEPKKKVLSAYPLSTKKNS